jgi:hypothetical protein
MLFLYKLFAAKLLFPLKTSNRPYRLRGYEDATKTNRPSRAKPLLAETLFSLSGRNNHANNEYLTG